MSLEKNYPNLIAKITEPVYDIRDLVVVDENYDDVDSDEFDVFEPDEYNFLIYVTERVQQALGEDKLQSLIKKLQTHEKFETFFASESDMYGVKCNLDEESIAEEIISLIEEELKC
jgi:hypothetical protein